jgi:4-carboxymuconolactone decarboxylase
MPSKLYEEGERLRRKVLGDAHVERALSVAKEDPFVAPLQEVITELGWGAVWGRPGLELKTRSIINLAMLTALNRPHEIKIHVKGALNNGLSKDDIKEIFMQTAIYCGVPAAVDSFRTAREVFKEMGLD